MVRFRSARSTGPAAAARLLGACLAAGLAGLIGGVDVAAAAAPANDNFSSRLTIQLQYADQRSNVEATNEASEPLTPNDPGNLGCSPQGSPSTTGVQSTGTLWWEFEGNGGPITVSTAGSDFDTVLGIYDANDQSLVACNDDIQPADLTRPELGFRPASEVVVQSVAGRKYAVQVGGCSPRPSVSCADTTAGSIFVRVSPTPPNDDRAQATEVATGATVTATNTGATLEAGEIDSCTRAETNARSLFAKTIWLRWTAPAPGTATFTSNGIDTVLTVYRAGDQTPIGCNDDAVHGTFSGSSLPMTTPAGPPVQVSPGQYFIQVGGYYDSGFSTIAARNGPLTVQVGFNEDLDIDNDGVQRGPDCQDNDPSIHPGAAEIPNNDTDENCDGIKAFDRDQDGHLAPPAGSDCDDNNALIHPGSPDVGDEGIDRDCNGALTALPQLHPIVALRSVPGKRVRLLRLSIKSLPVNSTVVLTCRSGTCRSSRSRRFTLRDGGARVFVSELRQLLRVRRGKRMLVRPGTKIIVHVSAPGYRSYQRSITLRRGVPTITDTCFAPSGAIRCAF